MPTRLGLSLLTLAATALLAGPARAADFAGTLGPAAPTFSWESSGSGVSDPIGFGFPGCGEAHNCDYIVLTLESPGDLKLELANPGGFHIEDPTGTFGGLGSLQDVDMYIYRANAAGEPEGDPITEEGASTMPAETANIPGLAAGKYHVRVEYFLAFEASYTGTATLSNFPAGPAAAAPPPAGGETPPPAPPQQQPSGSPQQQPQASPPAGGTEESKPAPKKSKKAKKAACVKKAKKIKNKAKRKKAIKRCSAKAKKRKS